MRIFTSYFYQLRFFPKNAIPLSTALSSPKWFRPVDGKPWRDKRGVWNGLTIPPLAPTQVEPGSCSGQPCVYSPDTCRFLRSYRKQLDSLDFDDIMCRLDRLSKFIQSQSAFTEEPIIILLVHEASDNPCSERKPIQQWFASHGVEVKEWMKC